MPRVALAWESAGTGNPHDQTAASWTRVAPGSSSAYYLIGPHTLGRWSAELIQMRWAEEVGSTCLGHHHSEDAAKAAALAHEHTGRTDPDGHCAAARPAC